LVPLKREAKNLLRASACRRGVRARTVTQSSTPPTTLLDGVAGQIAAIAMAQGLTLVTRNTKDFAALRGLRLVNWFES